MGHPKEKMKTRIQLDMSPGEVTRLNSVMEMCDLGTRKELFNNALTLLEWAAKEIAEGRKIAAFDEETRDRRILTMPALNAAETYYERQSIDGPSNGPMEEPNNPSVPETGKLAYG